VKGFLQESEPGSRIKQLNKTKKKTVQESQEDQNLFAGASLADPFEKVR